MLFRLRFAVHCGSLRQTAQIQSMSQECLRTGDKALVNFRFIKHPEYIKPGLRLVITIFLYSPYSTINKLSFLLGFP